MGDFGSAQVRDGMILLSRILMVTIFMIFGWPKLFAYGLTVDHFTQMGVPLSPIAAVVSITMECFVALAILIGVWTRPLAVLLGIYTLSAGFLGHRYWTLTGMPHLAAMVNFYKNVSMLGGFLLLYATGAGKYSVDAKIGLN
jgi:putative oxidoreductase